MNSELSIQIRERLIKKKHRRPQHECAGKGHALLLTARKLAWIASGQADETHCREHFIDTLAAFRLPRTDIAEPELHIFKYRKMWKQRVMLKYYPDIPKMRRFCCNVGAFDEHPAVRWCGEPRNQPQGSRFAAATRA